MIYRMQIRTERWEDFDDVDLAAIGAGRFVYNASTSHPTELRWTCLEPQHTTPIARGVFLRFWPEQFTTPGVNDYLDPDGDEFDEDNPLFAGYVEVIEPGESNEVQYTAYDPTYRSSKDVVVMSAAWEIGDNTADPPVPPVPDPTSVPRLVYNVKIDADDDFAYQVGQDGTVGELIAGLLEYCYHPLYWLDAAPGDGSNAGNDVGYLPDDLVAMAHRPQEKLTFESESVRSAVERMQRYEPRVRLFWDPKTKLWRFYNLYAAPSETIVLNSIEDAFPVLSLQLRPTWDHCITAIQVFGPEVAQNETFTWWATPPSGEENTLVPVGDGILLQVYTTASGTFQAQTWDVWQIVDPTKRRGANRLPQDLLIQMAAIDPEDYSSHYVYTPIREPVLQVSWGSGTTWTTVANVWIDNQNGKALFRGVVPYRVLTNSTGGSITPGSTQVAFPPNAVRLHYAPFIEPLSVRVPEEGYEGTAFELMNLQRTQRVYDEALAVGKEFGIPVTTAARRAQFETYAQTLLDERKDIAWSGGLALDGLDFRWSRLNRRVSLEAVDANGDALITGWEDIAAAVTDVEIDFEQELTTVQFSSNWLEMCGQDPAQLKERLKIKALQQRLVQEAPVFYFANGNTSAGSSAIAGGLAMSLGPNNWVSGVSFGSHFEYVDDPGAG